jgi:hypothetical protein
MAYVMNPTIQTKPHLTIIRYTPYLFISAASVSFGFVMWSITAAAAAAAADGSAAADQSLVGQLPPSQDVSLRDDVKM